jgi:hypothetical protein
VRQQVEVAAEPGHGVHDAERPLEPLADLDQQLVAVVVADGVVDLLEPVQVDEQRCRAQFAVGLADGLAGAVVQQGPVGYTRRRSPRSRPVGRPMRRCTGGQKPSTPSLEVTRLLCLSRVGIAVVDRSLGTVSRRRQRRYRPLP